MFIKTNVCAKLQPPPADLSLAGKTVLITGANSGIGFAAAKQVLAHGCARLVVAVRDLAKGERAAEALRANAAPRDQTTAAEILVWELDMTSYDSVRRFAARCATDLPPLSSAGRRGGGDEKSARGLDIAILNAGIGPAEHNLSPHTKHEVAIQTNYLSTGLLAMLLLPILRAGGGAGSGEQKKEAGYGRLSIVSSSMGHMAQFPTRDADPLLPTFDDAQNWVSGMERYSVSKLLLDMLVARLGAQALVDGAGNGVHVNAVEPGFVRSSNCKS